MVTAVFQILLISHVNSCDLSGTDDQPCGVSGTGEQLCDVSGTGDHPCDLLGTGDQPCDVSGTGDQPCNVSGTGDQSCDVSGTGDLVIECRQLWLSVLKLLCTLLQTQSAATLQCLTDVLNSIWIDFCGRWNRNTTL